jgi:hypothetical protein
MLAFRRIRAQGARRETIRSTRPASPFEFARPLPHQSSHRPAITGTAECIDFFAPPPAALNSEF